jgi:tRNA-specific 2-thiouridylase
VFERLKLGGEAGDIVDLDGRASARMPASSIHRRQRRGLGIAAGHPLYVVRLDAVAPGRGRPRAALRTSRMRLRDVNWLGEEASTRPWRRLARGVRQGPLHATAAAGVAEPGRRGHRGRSRCGRGRSVARPGLRVYDVADGQARVLGGGFIQSAVAATRAPPQDARGVRRGPALTAATWSPSRATFSICAHFASSNYWLFRKLT